MANQRTVTLYLDAVEQTAMREATDPEQWQRAIGYLSTWNMTFPTVIISKDGATDLTAVYRSHDGMLGYVIGAVWHGDHYGFHS